MNPITITCTQTIDLNTQSVLGSSNYTNSERFNPLPLVIEISRNSDGGYNIKFISFGFGFDIINERSFPEFVAPIRNIVGVSILSNNAEFVAGFHGVIEFQLPDPDELSSGINVFTPWKKGDKYRLDFDVGPDSFTHTLTSIVTRITQTFPTNGPTTAASGQLLLKQSSNIEVPIILIQGQSLIDGSDIGNMIFTIEDEIEYYKQKVPKKLNKCQEYFIDSNNIKTTIFDKCCPKIVSVVKGKGTTLYDKLWYIFDTENITIYFENFYPNLFFYAMLKYILARLLYGDFNVNYLLRKYNDKFIKDLTKSRFCGALPIFTECVNGLCVYNYDQYFLYE